MPGEAADGGMGKPGLRTLAEKVRWLIETAHPADRGRRTYLLTRPRTIIPGG